jgi:hypothetical protein
VNDNTSQAAGSLEISIHEMFPAGRLATTPPLSAFRPDTAPLYESAFSAVH